MINVIFRHFYHMNKRHLAIETCQNRAADMGGDVTEKASVEGAVRELEATMDDELPTGDEGRKNIEVNLAKYRKAKSGANQLLLKRLMRKVVESIVLEPGRIALRYWTSNELRDESQTQKAKRSSDSPSGASILSLKSCESSSLTPSSDGSRDKEVFGLQFIGIGSWGDITTVYHAFNLLKR